MSFILALIEYKIAILFYFLVFLIVYLNRKKFDVHGNFVYLYRTKIGIKFMNSVANKFPRLVRFLGYFGVAVGFIGMIFVFYQILLLAYHLIINKAGATGASPVIPGLPIAGTGLVFPLITGWVVIFLIIIIHEFSHGIVASAFKVRIKNSGIAFFGPILGAFVEPDEKRLVKEKDLVQHSVFAAGTFSNFLTVAIVMLVGILVLSPIGNALSVSKGIIIFSQPGLPAEKAGIGNNTIITAVNNNPVLTIDKFRKVMKDIGPEEKITIKSNKTTYTLTTASDPDNPSQGYLGIWVTGEKSELRNDNALNRALLAILQWIAQLFGWLAFLSLNIGLINLLPMFITDGARMLKVLFERIIPDKDRSLSAWLFFNWASLIAILTLVFLPFFRWLGTALQLY